MSTEDLVRAFDPLPLDAPALVVCPPVGVTTVAVCVAEILNALERSAVDLFPIWLPAVSDLADSSSAEAAVKAAALSLATGAQDFGPFLADLAVRAFTGRSASGPIVSVQQRATGLARVIGRSLGRSRIALVLESRPGQMAYEEQILAGTARWLAEQSGMAVWLVGEPLRYIDWIPSRHITVSEHRLLPPVTVEPAGVPLRLGAQGKAKSGTETALATALAQTDWAGAHIWNCGLELATIGPLVVPDIRWSGERLIVEIDGPEHGSVAMYGHDRKRDVRLLLNGYTVVRFTNDQVQNDMAYVLQTIRDVLVMRRSL